MLVIGLIDDDYTGLSCGLEDNIRSGVRKASTGINSNSPIVMDLISEKTRYNSFPIMSFPVRLIKKIERITVARITWEGKFDLISPERI